jgi:hypothetical protein
MLTEIKEKKKLKIEVEIQREQKEIKMVNEINNEGIDNGRQ